MSVPLRIAETFKNPRTRFRACPRLSRTRATLAVSCPARLTSDLAPRVSLQTRGRVSTSGGAGKIP